MDLVVGLGEIGSNLTALLKESKRSVCGFDKNPKLSFGEPRDIDLMHMCPILKKLHENRFEIPSEMEAKENCHTQHSKARNHKGNPRKAA